MLVTFDQHYQTIDAAACEAAWAKGLAYVAPAPGAKPPKKKK